MITYEIIRTKEQCEDLKALATEISLEHFTPITGEGQVYYMMEKFLAPEVVMREIGENYEFAFILYGGERAGYYSIAFEGEALFLSKLYLRSDMRGKHLSSLLLACAVELARTEGKRAVYLTCNKYNAHSLDVYHAKGFKDVDAVVTDIGHGFVMDDYILQLDL